MIKRTIVTTLPTTLAEGEEVYYRDPNGVQTLWVGHADGSAWPSVGYKELQFSIIGIDGDSIQLRIDTNTTYYTVSQDESQSNKININNVGANDRVTLVSSQSFLDPADQFCWVFFTKAPNIPLCSMVFFNTEFNAIIPATSIDNPFSFVLRQHPI